MHKKIYITGVGILSALGIGLEEHIKGLKEGKCGITFNSNDNNYFPEIAGFVPDFSPEDYVENKKSIRFLTRQVILGVASSKLAIKDAGLTKENFSEQENLNGVIYGAGITQSIVSSKDAFIPCIDENNSIDYEKLGGETYRNLPPLWILPRLPNTTAGQISIQYSIKGINYSVVNGVNNGIIAIGESYEAIKNDRAVRMVCGGSEWDPAVDFIYKLYKMKIASISREGSIPFDPQSDGIITSEAGCTLVLEEESQIEKRGVIPYCRINGYNNYYISQFQSLQMNEIVNHYKETMLAALADAKLNKGDIDFIQASGTGINKIDQAEAFAIKELFGTKPFITACTGAVGHTLAASGALSVAYAAIQLKNGFIAPIIRTQHPYYQNELNYVLNKPVIQSVSTCLCNSFDYYGSTSSIILKERTQE